MMPPVKRVAVQADYYTSSSSVKLFFEHCKLSTILNKSGFRKAKGHSVTEILFVLFLLPLIGTTISRITEESQGFLDIKKDEMYNFMSCHTYSWRNLLFNVAKIIVDFFVDLAKKRKEAKRNKDAILNLNRRSRFGIIDDTPIKKDDSEELEICGNYMYDHTDGSHYKGYSATVLLYSDGVSSVPLDVSLSATSNESYIETHNEKKYHKNSCGARRRAEVRMAKTDLAIKMVKNAHEKGIKFDYIMFDSWYSSPKVVHNIHQYYDVICNVKRGNQKYCYGKVKLDVEQIYSKIRVGTRKKIKCSCIVKMPYKLNDKEVKYIDVKLVYVKKRKSNDYLVLLSTDIKLSDKDIVKAYAIRWDIEVFFRNAKQNLRFDNGTQSNNFDSIIASVTLACLRHCFLAYAERKQSAPMTYGAFYRLVADELVELTLAESLEVILLHYAAAINALAKYDPQEADAMAEEMCEKIKMFKINGLEERFKKECFRLAA